MDLRGGWRTDGVESKVLAQRETSLQYGTQPEQALVSVRQNTEEGKTRY